MNQTFLATNFADLHGFFLFKSGARNWEKKRICLGYVFFWREGRDSNIISSMEARDWKIKTHLCRCVLLWWEGRDSNIISSMEARDWKIKTHLCRCVLLWREGRDSNPRLVLPSTHLAGEPIQPLWHLPGLIDDLRLQIDDTNRKSKIVNRKSSGGSGIRTHVGVTQTCFQDMRLQPLGHPSTKLRSLEAGKILP